MHRSAFLCRLPQLSQHRERFFQILDTNHTRRGIEQQVLAPPRSADIVRWLIQIQDAPSLVLAQKHAIERHFLSVEAHAVDLQVTLLNRLLDSRGVVRIPARAQIEDLACPRQHRLVVLLQPRNRRVVNVREQACFAVELRVGGLVRALEILG